MTEQPKKTRMGSPVLGAATPPTPAGPNLLPPPEVTPPRRTRMGITPAPVQKPVPAEGGAGSASGRTRLGGSADSAVSAASAGAEAGDGRAASRRMVAGSAGPRRQPPSGPPAHDKTARQRPRFLSFLADVSWKRMLAVVGGGVLALLAVVLLARWLRSLQEVQDFLLQYPGHPTLPADAPRGLPAWIGWQHFLNMFFMVLLVRTGLQVRHEKKAPAYFTPEPGSFFSPRGATPKKVSLSQWLHQSLDVLWMINGVVFFVVLAATGQWMRIVPTSLDVFPNAVSAALQYSSLDWPSENGWIHYNALQMLAYFCTVYIAAPLAVLSGIRLSTWWPDKKVKASMLYPISFARAIHFPVMLYFVVFTLVHVFLVFFTGALRNLNHMYTSRDVVDGWGLLVLIGSLVVVIFGWFLTKPLFTRPVAERYGTVSK